MKRLIIICSVLLLQGCVYFNERGVSGRYYNSCKEYYDATGTYHKKCDENIVDYDDIKKLKPTKNR